jgi:hypothetical protein
MKEKEPVYEALLLKREWAIINEANIKETIESSELVSETLEKMIKLIKEDEFGADVQEISVYEKKLIFAGLQVGNLLLQRQQESVMMETYQSILMQMLKKEEE